MIKITIGWFVSISIIAFQPVKSLTPVLLNRDNSIGKFKLEFPADKPNENQVRFTNNRQSDLSDATAFYFLMGGILSFLLGYRVFKEQVPHHKFGSTLAAFSGPIVVGVLLSLGFRFDGNMICYAIAASCFGYLIGAAFGMIWSIPICKFLQKSRTKNRQKNTKTDSELLNDIQLDLSKQLKAIDSCDVDEETKNDLQEAARQAAVERMARILESPGDQNSQ